MKEQQIKFDEKALKKLEQIANYSNRTIDEVVDDLVKTFCFMPVIVTGDLEDYCIQQIDKCDAVDKHRKSTLTEERIKSFNRIRYFVDQVYNAQTNLIKQIEE